jgi:superoxide dismutase, Fe-Mn family
MRYQTLIETEHKLQLIELPYNLGDLSPIMGQDTVKYHYTVLSKGYVDRYNSGEGDKKFNRAGALLHNLWWEQLQAPSGANVPYGEVMDIIKKKHDDWRMFKSAVLEEAKQFVGSGWIYLSKAGSIKTLANQTWADDIVFAVDMWEHSYYMDYPADKLSYIKNIWKIFNWNNINSKLEKS